MNQIIYRKVTLDLTHKEAFSMFIEKDKLSTWLVKEANVNPVIGGSYELFWDKQNKLQNSTIGCKITAIEENQLLCFEWKGPIQFASFMNEASPLTHVTISFIPAEKQTVIHLVHSGWKDNEEWEEARLWFDQVWKNALTKLKDITA